MKTTVTKWFSILGLGLSLSSAGCALEDFSLGLVAQDTGGGRRDSVPEDECADRADAARRSCLANCDSALNRACSSDCNSSYKRSKTACADLARDASAPTEPVAKKPKASGTAPLPVTPEPPFYVGAGR